MREVNTHKIIRIFLASSIDDTKEERDKLQNKILAVWNPIFNKFNMLQPVLNLGKELFELEHQQIQLLPFAVMLQAFLRRVIP